MNHSLLQVFNQSVCFAITQTLLHFLWEGLVIGLCTWMMARCFRRANAQVRYGIYAASLASMTFCVPVTFAVVSQSTTAFTNSLAAGGSLTTRNSTLRPPNLEAAFPAGVEAIPTAGPEIGSPKLILAPAVETADMVLATRESRFSNWLRMASPYTASIYLLGVALMLVRLCCALWGGHRLRRIATPVRDPRLLLQIREQAQRIGLRFVPIVAYCERIAIPAVAGALRPVILLPTWLAAELDPQQLHIILAHEMAHIRRFDLVLNVLQRLLETLLFFHPVVWYVSRQLSFERENCCDDAVVQAGYGSVQYAHTLVRMAELCSSTHRPIAASQLALLAASGDNTSQLKRRILRLLGHERQTGLTRGDSLTLVLLAVILGVTLVGVWQQAVAESPDQRQANVKPEGSAQFPSSKAEAAKIGSKLVAENLNAQISPPPANAAPLNAAPTNGGNTNDNAKEIEYSGTVLDMDGKPFAGAEIWILLMGRLNDDPSFPGMVKRLTRSGADGKFSFRIHRIPRSSPRIIAKAPGYCLDWMPLAAFENNPVDLKNRDFHQQRVDKALGAGRFASRTLKLMREAGPVQGRLVDLKGQPLSGVTVTVRYLSSLDFAMLKQAFEDSAKGFVSQALHQSGARAVALGHAELSQLLPPVKTNENGEFSLSGLGPDQIMTVIFTGEHVASVPLYIVGREMENKQLPHISSHPQGAQDVFVGLHFTHTIGPAVPVSGTVTEFQSGKPIANATVFVDRLFEENSHKPNTPLRMLMQHVYAVTDEQGRYRLLGIPPGTGHVLHVIVPKSEPWLMGSQTFAIDSKQSELNLNLKVFRGIWIEGKITDAQTGEPITGYVDYLALKRNPHIPQKFGLSDWWDYRRFPTDASGHYRVVGLPGPGVLFVRSSEKRVYPLSVGAEKIESYNPKNASFLLTTPTGMPLSNWNRIEQIDPPVDAKSYQMDFTLSAGMELTGHVVDANGQPASSIEAVGEVDKDVFFRKLEAHKFVVYNYDATVPRDLFFKATQNSLVGHLHLEGPPPAALTVGTS
ncbi:MAG: M56 family metallopeptidase [Planctomycetota bacterium]